MNFQVGTSAGVWKMHCLLGVKQKENLVSLRGKHEGEQVLKDSVQWVMILFIMVKTP